MVERALKGLELMGTAMQIRLFYFFLKKKLALVIFQVKFEKVVKTALKSYKCQMQMHTLGNGRVSIFLYYYFVSIYQLHENWRKWII